MLFLCLRNAYQEPTPNEGYVAFVPCPNSSISNSLAFSIDCCQRDSESTFPRFMHLIFVFPVQSGHPGYMLCSLSSSFSMSSRGSSYLSLALRGNERFSKSKEIWKPFALPVPLRSASKPIFLTLHMSRAWICPAYPPIGTYFGQSGRVWFLIFRCVGKS